MADQTYYSVFTKQGLALLTEAIQNGTKLGITSMAFGDGGGSLPVPNEEFTQLVNEVHRTQLNSLAPDPNNANWLRAEAIIASAVGGFNIRELGLYAGDVLVAYSNYPATYKPNPSDGTARIMTFRMVLQIDNTSNFDLVIDPDVVLATIQSVEDAKLELYQNSTGIVDSIADLDKIIKWPGRTVYVKSYYLGQKKGGGIRIYDASRSNENDNFLCIDGWVLQQDNPTTFNPLQAGAFADGNNDDQHAIKRCIAAAKALDAKARVAIDDNYYVGSTDASTSFMFTLHSNLEISGTGSITCLAGSNYFNSAAIVGYGNNSDRLSNVKVADFTIDCNKDNVISSASTAESSVGAVNINNVSDCEVTGLKVRNTLGGGIYVRQGAESEKGGINVLIKGNIIENIGYIGIQCRRPYNVTIDANILSNCNDNCIDVEGVKKNDMWNGYVKNLIISDNNCDSGNTGIFLESIGKATITGNHILNCNNGIYMNYYSDAETSYSIAKDILITGNTFDGGDKTNAIGITCYKCGWFSASANNFINLRISFSFYQSSAVSVGVNMHIINANSKYIFYIPKTNTTNTNIIWSCLEKQKIVMEKHLLTPSTFLYATPFNYPHKTGLLSSALTVCDGILNMKTAKNYDIATDEQYKYLNTNLVNTHRDWNGSYAVYVSNETRVTLNLTTTAAINNTIPGCVFMMNGNHYIVLSVIQHSGSTHELTIRKFDANTGTFVAGNYSSELNSALNVIGYIYDWFNFSA